MTNELTVNPKKEHLFHKALVGLIKKLNKTCMLHVNLCSRQFMNYKLDSVALAVL